MPRPTYGPTNDQTVRLGWHGRPAKVIDRWVRQDLVEDADPVEAEHDRQPARDRRGAM